MTLIMKIPDAKHQVFLSKIEDQLSKFKLTGDFYSLELELAGAFEDLLAPVLEEALNQMLSDPQYLAVLKFLCGEKGLSFREYRKVGLRILNGREITVQSPYFFKRREKKPGRKRTKRSKGNNPFCHPGLALTGFVSRCSPFLVSEVTKLALLSPSLQVSSDLLAERQIQMDVKTIRSICRNVGLLGLENRGRISLPREMNLEGYTLAIGTDGGRLRERRTKRGRKPEGNKRQGYHSDWYEPKLITIYLIDRQGQVVDSFKPLYDATMERADATFELLGRYLRELPLEQLDGVVFCGDGAPWIWERVESMVNPLLPGHIPLYQVIDFTHAKQALGRIADLLPKKLPPKKAEKIRAEWEKALWEGEIDLLGELIAKQFKTKNSAKARKKWNSYFKSNQKRMNYAEFKRLGIPCGSGCVESAIRRVINLRMKSPGTFWTKEMAEVFLFLRAQLISGRWDIFLRNLRQSLLYDLETGIAREEIGKIKPGWELWALVA